VIVEHLLLAFSRSTWWNFSMDEFEEKKRNSFAMPVFVVCYSRWCPHCSGLPEGTVQYSDSDRNRSDVYVTMIDCVDYGRECGLFHISGTPHMQLVIGPKRKYWQRVWSRIGTDWNVFIDKYVKPSLREIATNEELRSAIREPTDGGSTFHLETPSADHEIVKQLANCSVEWTAGELHDFLDKYKFESRHQYDQDEYKLISRHKKMAVVVVEEGLVGGQSYALEKTPQGYRDDVTFGWLSAKDSKGMLKQFQMNTTDLPAVVYSSKNECRAVFKGKTIEAGSSGFLRLAADGHLCGQVIRGAIPPEAIPPPPMESEKVDESRVILMYFTFGMVLYWGGD
jgi:hypothetical protein